MNDKLRVGLLGCGNIASGVVALLRKNSEFIAQRAGIPIEIVKVFDKTPERATALGFSKDSVAGSAEQLINSPDVDVVLELMGGADFAHECCISALKAGKHVVTANKDMMAKYWNDLFKTAAANGGYLGFEASVGGGIPIIGSAVDVLAANDPKRLLGILNGTTNFIISSMAENGAEYSEALAETQRLGYAEPDPTADVSGLDAARKLAILSCLIFRHHVEVEDIFLEGIASIEKEDIAAAGKLGYTLKLICLAEKTENGFLLCVRPMLLPSSHPLASVLGSFNALYLSADPLEDVMLYGKGAGRGPTASSIAGDLIQCARGYKRPDLSCENTSLALNTEICSRFFVRIACEDRSVLSSIFKAFELENILLSNVQKLESNVVLTTEKTNQISISAVCEKLMHTEGITKVKTYMILEEQSI